MSDIEQISEFLPLPVIDARDEETIAQQAQLSVYNSSRSLLNDFTDGSPVAALIQGQSFAAAELLYYANKLPLALLIEFLQANGIKRRLGQKATVELTFSLIAPRSTPFVIDQGTEVLHRSGQYSFYTDRQLVIGVGSTSGKVTATAKEATLDYNLPEYSINQLTQAISFVSGVVNIEASQGGGKAESIPEYLTRAFAERRKRALVSGQDYEQSAEEVLGSGSKVKAIGLLGANKSSEELGAVHLFCLDGQGNPANQAQLLDVSQQIGRDVQLGTRLYVSPMEISLIKADLICKIGNENPTAVAQALWAAFQSYLNPLTYQPGQTLKVNELQFALRLVPGIQYIEQLLLTAIPLSGNIPHGDINDIPMANVYTIPQAYSLSIQLLNAGGDLFKITLGDSEPPNYNPT